MELSIVKQIKELRQVLRCKPKKVMAQTIIKVKLIKVAKPTGRPARFVELFGEQTTIKDIALDYGLHIKTVEVRYRRGNRGNLLIRPAQKSYKRVIRNLTNLV